MYERSPWLFHDHPSSSKGGAKHPVSHVPQASSYDILSHGPICTPQRSFGLLWTGVSSATAPSSANMYDSCAYSVVSPKRI